MIFGQAGGWGASCSGAGAGCAGFADKTRQGFEARASRAGIDGAGSESGSFAEIPGTTGGNKRGRCIGQNRVARRTWRAGQNAANDPGIALGVAAVERSDRRARKAEILGRNFVSADAAATQLSEERGSAERDFVETFAAVNYEGTFDTQLSEREGQALGEIGGEDASDLRGSSGGIGKRAEEIESGAKAEFATSLHGVLHRRMNGRGE